MNGEKENIVYHYCSIESFLKIIEHYTLWLSDIRKLNDSQEYIWARDQLDKIIENLITDLAGSTKLELWNEGKNFANSYSITCAACFSQHRNLLSQWRGYADDGSGVAIGFSKKILQRVNNKMLSDSCRFTKISYSVPTAFINKTIRESWDKMQHKGIGKARMEFELYHPLDFASFKHPGFAKEGEWRIMYIAHPNQANENEQTITFPGIPKFSNIQYRIFEGKIIPFVEMNFKNIKNRLIREIIIGPKSRVTKQDIETVLLTYDYDLDKVNIDKSLYPYC